MQTKENWALRVTATMVVNRRQRSKGPTKTYSVVDVDKLEALEAMLAEDNSIERIAHTTN